MLDVLSFSLAISALIIATVSGGVAFFAWSTVVGLKNSTHRIQYVPVKDPEFNQFSDSDLNPKIDEEGNELPINGGDETTGLGLLKQFKDNIHMDEED